LTLNVPVYIHPFHSHFKGTGSLGLNVRTAQIEMSMSKDRLTLECPPVAHCQIAGPQQLQLQGLSAAATVPRPG
jgi:hypothetical protein